MNSSEHQQHTNGELILKTEEYDCPNGGQRLSPNQSVSPSLPSLSFNSAQLQSQSRAQSLTAVNRGSNLNTNLTVNCEVKVFQANTNNLSLTSPKLEPSSSYNCQGQSASPQPGHQERMPIAAPIDLQTSAAAGSTPGQHSISPSFPPQSTSGHSSSGGVVNSGGDHLMNNTRRMTSILGGYGLVPPGLLGPLDHYRLQLYSYAMNVERLRSGSHQQQYSGPLYASAYSGSPGVPVSNGPYAPTRFALSMGLFPNRMFQPEEPKPQHSYIGLIAMAILSSPESKLVLSDIYQYILDNYPYFRSRGPGWRNSIRHNLSLNDCFIKVGRSANGKGHYWAVHPANLDDFRKGDFRRRKAQRKVRKHMGLAVDDEGTDSPSPPPLALTPPTMAPPAHSGVLLVGSNPYVNAHHPNHQHYPNSLSSVIISGGVSETTQTTTAAGVIANLYSQTRKRQFDVASLLAPDDTSDFHRNHHHHLVSQYQQSSYKSHNNYQHSLMSKQRIPLTEDEDIDVVASDVDEEQEQDHDQEEQEHNHRIEQDHVLTIINRSPSSNHNLSLLQQSSNQDKIGANNSSSPVSFSPPLPINFNNQSIYHQNSSSPHRQPSSSGTASSCVVVADIRSNNNNQNSTAMNNNNNWRGLIQHWPNEFGSMDPQIFGRYYSQYMAAAAARRVAGVFPAAAAVAAAAVIGHQHQNTTNKQQLNSFVSQQHSASLQQQKQHQQQSYEC